MEKQILHVKTKRWKNSWRQKGIQSDRQQKKAAGWNDRPGYLEAQNVKFLDSEHAWLKYNQKSVRHFILMYTTAQSTSVTLQSDESANNAKVLFTDGTLSVPLESTGRVGK